MTIKHKKKGGRVYLEEYKSVRINGKIKSIYVRSLGPEKPVKRAKKPRPKVLDRLQLGSSHKAGDITLLWKIARDLRFVEIIDNICFGKPKVTGPSPGKLLTAWAINRAIDPQSCTKLESWMPTTDLPRLMGLSPTDFTKGSLLEALDFVCYNDRATNQLIDNTSRIEEAIYLLWRQNHPLPSGKKETVAYDLSTILFFGITCPLTELGHNPNKIKRRQVNIALLVSKWDKCPISHFVYSGSRNSSSTVKNLIAWLTDSAIEPGTIIWDRGFVSEAHVKLVDETGWKLICGVPRSSNAASNIIDTTDVRLTPVNHIHKSKSNHIYAIRKTELLFGKKRSVVVYMSQGRRSKEIDAQNEALADIGKELDGLSEEGKEWPEGKLHKKIKSILGSWKTYVHTRVKRKGNGPRIEWKYKEKAISNSEQSYGKYLLLSTDEALSAEEIVKAYFEKDFIEKAFRNLKTHEELEPVRHRLDRRVRAYIFVCVLATRLMANFQFRLKKVTRDTTWELSETLLRDLGQVNRVKIRLGQQVKICFLNLKKKTQDILKSIGLPDLFEETIEVDFKL